MAIVPGLRWMVGLMIAAIVIVGLYFGREILIPLALAVLLGFLLDPAVTRLHRWGLPRLAAALLVVALALGALAGLGLYLGKQVQALSADLPTYQTTIKQKLRNLRVLTAVRATVGAVAAQSQPPRRHPVQCVKSTPCWPSWPSCTPHCLAQRCSHSSAASTRISWPPMVMCWTRPG